MNEAYEETVSEAVAVEEYIVPSDTHWTAYGNEPGWRLMILRYKNDSLSYHLLANYGQEIYTGNCLKQEFGADNYSTYALYHADKRSGTAQFTQGKCIDDADQEFEYQLTLTWKENRWNGCANNKITR